jgi:hypothetical protein
VTIEPQRRHGDDVHIDIFEGDAGSGGMPSRRARTTCTSSSAANSSTGPLERSESGADKGTGGDRDRKIEREEGLEDLGLSPMIPTASALHRPSISQLCVEGGAAASCAARMVGKGFMMDRVHEYVQ